MRFTTPLFLIAGVVLVLVGMVLVYLEMPGAALPFFPGIISLVLGIALKVWEKRKP